MDAEAELEAEDYDKRRPRKKRKKSHLNPSAKLEEKHELEGRLKGEMFKYREVEPNDFGLTAEEVCLMMWLPLYGVTGRTGFV